MNEKQPTTQSFPAIGLGFRTDPFLDQRLRRVSARALQIQEDNRLDPSTADSLAWKELLEEESENYRLVSGDDTDD